MNGFERRKEQKKDAIRQAALELFKDLGVRKVTIGEIARKAAVSPVTIYNHFGSKEGLVRDVVKHFLQGLLEKYEAILSSERPFLEKLETIVFDKTQIGRDYSEEFMQSLVSSDPEIRRFADSMFEQQVSTLITGFFREGQTQGYIDPDVSQETLLLYHDIFRRGIQAHPGLFAAPEQNERLIRELSRIYLYGVIGRRDGGPEDRSMPERS